MQKNPVTKSILVVAAVALIFLFNFSAATPNSSSMSLSDSDTLIIDTTIVIDDTTFGDVDSVVYDSICYRIRSGGRFEILGKFGFGTPPSFAWVKVGSTWYGPLPNTLVLLPNTYVYSSNWFNQIIESPFGLGCVYVKFTYNTNFYSYPSFTRRVCPCN